MEKTQGWYRFYWCMNAYKPYCYRYYPEKKQDIEEKEVLIKTNDNNAPFIPQRKKSHTAFSKHEKEVENLTEKQRSMVEHSTESDTSSALSTSSNHKPRIEKLKALFECNSSRESRSAQNKVKAPQQVTRSHSIGAIRWTSSKKSLPETLPHSSKMDPPMQQYRHSKGNYPISKSKSMNIHQYSKTDVAQLDAGASYLPATTFAQQQNQTDEVVSYGLVAGVKFRRGSQDDIALSPSSPPRVRRHASIILLRHSLIETTEGDVAPLSVWGSTQGIQSNSRIQALQCHYNKDKQTQKEEDIYHQPQAKPNMTFALVLILGDLGSDLEMSERSGGVRGSECCGRDGIKWTRGWSIAWPATCASGSSLSRSGGCRPFRGITGDTYKQMGRVER
uniref:Uncharacterized protein n=1 Tax=Timema bartmani TaxID=61472 RepID=A0A7R9HZ31_9NEOP|nr:unnamed protein product [Timema bartmani]